MRILVEMADFDIYGAGDCGLDDLKRFVMRCGTRREVPRNTCFAWCGERCGEVAYVCHGSFKYVRSTGGRERIFAFMFENEFIADYIQSRNGGRSLFDIRAMEDSVIYAVSVARHAEFFEREIDGAVYVRRFAEAIAMEHLQKWVSSVCDSPKERYLCLRERVPDIFERVNLKDIASYIGVRPETLSRMRTSLLRADGR